MNGGIAERQLSPWEGTGTSIWILDNDIAFPTKRKMLPEATFACLSGHS